MPWYEVVREAVREALSEPRPIGPTVKSMLWVLLHEASERVTPEEIGTAGSRTSWVLKLALGALTERYGNDEVARSVDRE